MNENHIEGVQEAIQILELMTKVGGGTVNLGLKLGSGMKASTVQLFGFVYQAVMTAELRTKGKTTIDKLIKKEGGELQCLRCEEGKAKEMQKKLKKMGVIYSVLPDLNKKDGMVEFIFPSSATSRVNSVIEAMKFGEIIDFQEYHDNASPDELEKLKEDVREDMGIDSKKSFTSVEISQEMSPHSSEYININESFIIGETEEHIIVSMPGEENEYLLFDWQGVQMNENNSLRIPIDLDKDYILASGEGILLENIPGTSIMEDGNLFSPGDNVENLDITEALEKTIVPDSRLSILNISRQAGIGETTAHIIVRVPGENNQFIVFDKKDAELLESNQVRVLLDSQKDYPVFSGEGELLANITGQSITEMNVGNVVITSDEIDFSTHHAADVTNKPDELEASIITSNDNSKQEQLYIADAMSIGETEDHIVVRVPGQEEQYMLFDKKDAERIELDHIKITLDKEREYIIADGDGKILSNVSGSSIKEMDIDNVFVAGDVISKSSKEHPSLQGLINSMILQNMSELEKNIDISRAAAEPEKGVVEDENVKDIKENKEIPQDTKSSENTEEAAHVNTEVTPVEKEETGKSQRNDVSMQDNSEQKVESDSHHETASNKKSVPDADIKKIHVNDKMWVGSTEKYHVIKLANQDRYFLVEKENAHTIQNGKNLEVSLDISELYNVCNSKGDLVNSQLGEVIYRDSYELQFGSPTVTNQVLSDKMLNPEMVSNIDKIPLQKDRPIIKANSKYQHVIDNTRVLEEKLKEGKVIGADEKHRSKKGSNQSYDIPPETKKELDDFAKAVNIRNERAKEDTKAITINEKLWKGETSTHYITRIPFKQDEFLLLPKDKTNVIDDGKTLAAYLDMKKTYNLCDQNGKPLSQKSGQQLYDAHYDPVKRNIKDKSKSATKSATKTKKEHPAATRK